MASSDWRHSRSIQTSLAINEDVPSIEYLAGFFDGEGCFTCTIPEGDEPVYFKITISSTDRDQASAFKDRFGGSLSQRDPGEETHSTWWQWMISGRRARMAAEQLHPHLREKKEQCGVFIDAVTYKYSHRRSGVSGSPYTTDVIEELGEWGKRVRSYSSAQRRFKGGE